MAADPVYLGSVWTINETIQMVAAGALRVINHGDFGSYNFYWDQVTGLVTQSFSYGTNYTLLSTTAWAPDTVPSLFNMTTIVLIEGVVIIVLVIALIVLASRRRRS
jgi:hypothetical protein